jgi:hypothetical protein
MYLYFVRVEFNPARPAPLVAIRGASGFIF